MCRIVVIVVSCLALGSTSLSQRTSRQSCKISRVDFACPKGLKPLPIESGQAFVLFFRKDYGLGLFVALLAQGFDERKFMSDVTRTTLTRIFPKASQAYAWKPLNFSDSVSKFEVGGGMMQGFNGSMGVLIKYRHLKVNGEDILVGYASEFGRGTEAKESFQRGLGGDTKGTIAGCNASVEVIYSITGERIDENNPPCSLDVRVGGSSTHLP